MFLLTAIEWQKYILVRFLANSVSTSFPSVLKSLYKNIPTDKKLENNLQHKDYQITHKILLIKLIEAKSMLFKLFVSSGYLP
jgi:hypothetical protein